MKKGLLQGVLLSNKVNFLSNDKIKEIKYDESVVKLLLLKVKKENITNEKRNYYRNQIIKQTYPIIFSLIKKINYKFNMKDSILSNDDLFNEGVLIISNCIDGYDKTLRIKFITYIWSSLYRGFLRKIERLYLRPNNMFLDREEHDEDYNEESEEFFVNKKSLNKIFNNQLIFNEEQNTFHLERLNSFEKNFLFLRYKKYNVKEICNMLELNVNDYYRIFNKIKNKINEE